MSAVGNFKSVSGTELVSKHIHGLNQNSILERICGL